MGDSNFFGDIHGHKEDPVGRFNAAGVGPLPPKNGLEGLFGPLSHINTARTELLGGHVAPYNKDPSFSQEPSYLEIPHSIPKVIPVITLPNADGTGRFQLTRSVNYGDVAWTMRSPEGMKRYFVDNNNTARTQWGDFPRDPIINVSTANYLLRGIQRWANLDKDEIEENDPGYWWVVFRTAMEINLDIAERPSPNDLGDLQELFDTIEGTDWDEEVYLRKLINIFRPLGIVHGSNKQGGQHQGGSVVTWPVDYVSTLVVDGKAQNLSNYWRHQEIWAGDDLRFVLRWVPAEDAHKIKTYTLTSVPKSMHAETFGDAPPNTAESLAGGFYQFFPETSRPGKDNCGDFHHITYWHVARSRVTFGAMPHATKWRSASDETQAANGVVLEVTWNPYERTPSESVLFVS